jgi:hypothetical protein
MLKTGIECRVVECRRRRKRKWFLKGMRKDERRDEGENRVGRRRSELVMKCKGFNLCLM